MSLKSLCAVCAILSTAATCLPDSATALDLQGSGIRIKGLVRHYTSTGRLSSGQPEDPYNPPAESASDSLSFYEGGTTIAWHPMYTPSCQNADGYTSVVLLYAGRGGARRGRVTCNPTVSGGASKMMDSATSGSFSTTARVSGNVVTLTGTMQFVINVRGSANGSSNYLDRQSTTIRQSMSVEVAGSSCRVLSYTQRSDTRSDRKGLLNDGRPYTAFNDRHGSLNPSSDLSCSVF